MYGQNIEALDVTAYYIPSYPEVPSDEYIYELKRKAFGLGINMTETASGTILHRPIRQSGRPMWNWQKNGSWWQKN